MKLQISHSCHSLSSLPVAGSVREAPEGEASANLPQKSETNRKKEGEQTPDPLNSERVRITLEDDLKSQPKQIPCDCEDRYFKHYEAKNCTPIYNQEDGCKCPTRFQCPATNEQQEVCTYQGKTYQLGQEIVVTDSCRKCACQQGYTPEDGAVLSCFSIECPELFFPPPKPGCYHVYDNESCCAVRTICKAACNYNGKTYELGQRIYPDEDSCLTCICTEEWSGLDSPSCRKIDCLLEEHLHQLRRGCLPIYHASSCCPIEYHCPSRENTTLEQAVESESKSNLCFFDQKYYTRGEVLDINHPTNCVTCSCNTPPELTCIHQSCPAIPNDDYENCEPTYHPGVCCPEYTCRTTSENVKENNSDEAVLIGPPPEEDSCASVICAEDEKCVMFRVACVKEPCPPLPTCIKVNPECPIPNCAPGCVVENRNKQHCPSCICGSPSEPAKISNERCPVPVCEGNDCILVDAADGCKVCLCITCAIPDCPASCEIQKGTHEGQCPSCICRVEEVKDTYVAYSNIDNRRCPVPVCEGYDCVMVNDGNGCRTCLCATCEIPECPEGCELQEKSREGQCPSCTCRVQETENTHVAHTNIGNRRCPVPVCEGYDCVMVNDADGCRICFCIACEIPKCPEGCKLQEKAHEGQCPSCTCEVQETENSHVVHHAPEKQED
ncbi:kielin/chordin-like protein [Tachypleus tridentatus]|uniref:kielin/chordin-like protein n=1 Tax=Tachypleus tridentatus TaxID=6853 RepID=UPI003FD092A4